MAHSLTEQSREAVANSTSDGAQATPSTMRWCARATLASSSNGTTPAGIWGVGRMCRRYCELIF